ncbi:hypothetical protein HCA81_05390 [Listeria booriae]|uniref:hypothetical protein n=1 Tax=Listeria booriae TaxID=1552123 RepID=UPI00162333B9|nr:hypothetical protein [Listeria booriae]MBC2020474.1 hypothetical protein [Listeria booriae]
MTFFDDKIAQIRGELKTEARQKELQENLTQELVNKGIAEGELTVDQQMFTFHSIALAEDAIWMSVPTDFDEMNPEMVTLKYPSSHRPQLILTDDSSKFNVTFLVTNNEMKPGEMSNFTYAMLSAVRSMQPNTVFLSDGIKELSNQEIGYLEMLTPALDGTIYNLLFFAVWNKKIVQTSINCMEEDMALWRKFAHGMMETFIVKEE